MSLSVLILTFNEEINLSDCLESISWCDDIVVLDSFSSDQTIEIAKKAGIRVFQRKFDDFAGQRNYALNNIVFKYSWIFHLDADERFTDELYYECMETIAHGQNSGYMVSSKMIFRGKWLRWAATYPTYQMRLMKLGEICFVQKGHGQREDQALHGTGFLRAPYLHYSFSKGFSDWFAKHNRYSTHEAREYLEQLEQKNFSWRKLFVCDPIKRRRALKKISFQLPLRPWLKFIYMYFWRLGFLDGYPGLTYCTLQAIYEYMICLKIKELER